MRQDAPGVARAMPKPGARALGAVARACARPLASNGAWRRAVSKPRGPTPPAPRGRQWATSCSNSSLHWCIELVLRACVVSDGFLCRCLPQTEERSVAVVHQLA